MEIQHRDNGTSGRFFIEQNGSLLAAISYKLSGNNLIIEKTVVDNSLSGQGIGKLLVKNTVEFARENNLKIISHCPFAKAILDKTEEFQDVIE